MIWHIAKRELYDNMTSLRFAIVTLLLLGLMAVNAVNHLGKYRSEIADYRKKVNAALDVMRERTDRLYTLIHRGPGNLYKKPSPLRFCASGGDAFLSELAKGQQGGSNHGATVLNEDGEKVYTTVSLIWRMYFPQSNSNLRNFSPPFTKLDWAFLVGVVLSFISILFTFDAISGERERGTLRLMLAGSVPRDSVLMGKFLGALLSIGLPFVTAALVNLFLLSVSGSVQLSASEWGRLGAILLIATLYVSIFIALGLLVSARARLSSVSLVVLLLIWTVFVLLMPATLGSISRGLKPTMTSDEYRSRRSELWTDIWNQYDVDSSAMQDEPMTREIPPNRITASWSAAFTKEAHAHEKLNEEQLRSQISQIQLARNLSRTSPTAILQYAIEALAGAGLSRHLDFLDQVRQYGAEFRRFLIETDAADPESPHAIGVWIGGSQKPVNFDAIPKFEDRVSFSASLNAALVDVLLLILFLIVLFGGGYLSFLRVDI